MSTRRDSVLDAAIALLAGSSARALTHRAVDRAAGVPLGSTSNLFRTRAALVRGVFDRLAERERINAAAIWPIDPARDADNVVDVMTQIVRQALTTGRELTLARRVLFNEAAQDHGLSRDLLAASEPVWALVEKLLDPIVSDRAGTRARWLIAYLDGIIADQLSRPEGEFDVREAVRGAVCGALAAPADSASSAPIQR